MSPQERLAQHAAALKTARDSLSFALGEIDDARHALVEHATPDEANQLASARGALDALVAVGHLTVQLIKAAQDQVPLHTPLDELQAVAEADQGSEHDLG